MLTCFSKPSPLRPKVNVARVPTRTVYFLIISLTALGITSPGWALPQFGIQFGSELHTGHAHEQDLMTLDCRACHINPTGAGMRNAHGRKFSIEQLPMIEKTEAMRSTIEAAQLNPFLSIGTDLRFAYLRTEQESNSEFKDSFFPMQADLYVTLTPTEYMTVYHQDGVERSGSRETFVLFRGQRYNGHFKAGRFIPPYGLKLDDHTTFIRDKLGFGAPFFGQDAGLELGLGTRHWFGNAAVFNGSGKFGDDNNEKGISAAGGWKSPLFWLAGSYFNNETDNKNKTYVGGYGALHFWRLTFLGEWDQFKVESNTKNANTGSVLLGEVGLQLTKGANAIVRYERCKEDTDDVCDFDDANDKLERLTIGFYLYPAPFTEVIIQYRKNTEGTEIKNDHFLAMLHVFY